MNRTQLENIYKSNGITDYKLETMDDILKVHGINFEKVNGYKNLSEDDKQSYRTFLIKYMNGLGLDYRINFIPTGIHYVELTIYYKVEVDEEGPCYEEVGRDIIDLYDNTMYKKYRDNGYEQTTEFDKIEKSQFLRIDYLEESHYETDTGERWLHIIDDGNQWY